MLLELLLGSLSLHAHPAGSNTVLTVDDDGPADFAQVRDAVLAAPEGATLLVRPGLYRGFVADGKGLQILGESGVLIGGSFTADIDTTMITNLAANQEFVLQGVELVAPLRIQSNAGSVWVEDCLVSGSIASGFVASNTNVVDSASVVFRDCELRGIPAGTSGDIAGLSVSVVSQVHVFDSVMLGGTGGFDGGDGASVRGGSFLFASGSTFDGGDGIDLGDFPGCEPDGLATCIGGNGVTLSLGSEAVLVNPTLSFGTGPNAPGENLSIAPGSSATVLHRSPRRVSVPGPLTAGQPTTIELEGSANEVAVILYSDGMGGLYLPGFLSSLVLASPLLSLAPLVLDPAGSASLMLVPALPPGTLSRTLFVQPLFFDPSGVPGSQVTLGAGTAVTILDPAL